MGIIAAMDAFFVDPDVERLPPALVRLLDVRSDPSPDGQRIRLTLDLTPFQKRPNLELTLTAPDGSICGSTSILEPMGWKMQLTLHNRLLTPVPGIYHLKVVISYPDLGEVESRQVMIELPHIEKPE